MTIGLWLSTARAATLHVDDDAAPGGDGSAERPYADVQDAVDAARDGDEILVAGGTYGPVEVALVELVLRGGLGTDFTSPGDPSVVQGSPSVPAVSLYEVGQSVLEGFVLRGGQRGLVIDADYLSTTNRPTVRSNVIEQNGDPTRVGGGVYADHCGATLVGNTVRDNVADRGPGVAATCASLRLEGNVVEDNVAYGDHGGGVYLAGGDLQLVGNVVRDNEVGVVLGYGWGAGALVFGEGSVAHFEGNEFTGNHAASVGSGVFVDDGAVAEFDGDLFHHNVCPSMGGAALYVDGYGLDVGSHATLARVTIADHDCPRTGGNPIYLEAQSSVEITDSILWNNGRSDWITDRTSSVTARYTLTGAPRDGEGNLSADPLFADPERGDYHVRSTRGRYEPATGRFVTDDVDSPTIDAGDPAGDPAAEPAPNGGRINLGHTGGTAEASLGAGRMPDGRGRAAAGGCSSAGGPPGAGAALVLLAALRRRSAMLRR